MLSSSDFSSMESVVNLVGWAWSSGRTVASSGNFATLFDLSPGDALSLSSFPDPENLSTSLGSVVVRGVGLVLFLDEWYEVSPWVGIGLVLDKLWYWERWRQSLWPPWRILWCLEEVQFTTWRIVGYGIVATVGVNLPRANVSFPTESFKLWNWGGVTVVEPWVTTVCREWEFV